MLLQKRILHFPDENSGLPWDGEHACFLFQRSAVLVQYVPQLAFVGEGNFQGSGVQHHKDASTVIRPAVGQGIGVFFAIDKFDLSLTLQHRVCLANGNELFDLVV